MPLYEYSCNKCGYRFELIQKFSDQPITKCEQCSGKVTKLISAPGLSFKGTGWYITDYSSKSKPPDSKEQAEKPSENTAPSDTSKEGTSPDKEKTPDSSPSADHATTSTSSPESNKANNTTPPTASSPKAIKGKNGRDKSEK
ncbi:MAG: transcriptional regulator [Nitrospiraceae bacterium]|nr:transcriptional regulator [Nitrospiraceae bacterium]|tara:strand:- start:781 stop:1206 length:426 start_codon:yes stop_codon:yes gene_type:complete